MSRQSQSLYDRHITVFSPQGKLFQVEYAFRAVKGCNLTAVAIRGPTCACIAVQRRVPNLQQGGQTEKLLDLRSVRSVWKVTAEQGCVFVGIPGDARSMVYRAMEIANKYEYENSHKMPPDLLALKVANTNQVYTQHAYMRLRACEGLFIGIDEETKKPTIFRVDPAGWFAGYNAVAIGAREQEGMNLLEKVLKNENTDISTDDKVVEETIATLQTIVGTDFKPIDVEVALVSLSNPKFRELDEQAIERHLNNIAERD